MKPISFEDLSRINEFHFRQVKMLQDAILGPQPKSDCCHAEVTTFAFKDVCSCCLEQCELEK